MNAAVPTTTIVSCKCNASSFFYRKDIAELTKMQCQVLAFTLRDHNENMKAVNLPYIDIHICFYKEARENTAKFHDCPHHIGRHSKQAEE